MGRASQARRRWEASCASLWTLPGFALWWLLAFITAVGCIQSRRSPTSAKEREAELERAARRLRIVEEARGPEHAETARAVNDLAGVYDSGGDYASARPLFERALAIREKVLGPDHPETVLSLHNLASLYESQGDLALALPLCEREVATCEKALGPRHADTARSLNDLASVHHSRGDFASARPLYERALAIREKVLGPQHPDTATSLKDLAGVFDSGGDDASARPLFERALAIREKALGPEHRDTANSLNNLAGLYCSQGDQVSARRLQERALAIVEMTCGLEHRYTALSLNNLAAAYWSQGDYALARPFLERALAVQEKVLGPKHPEMALSLSNLAALFDAQGDYAAARPLYERAVAIREEALGPGHPDTAISLDSLALVMEDLGGGMAAWDLLARAERARRLQLDHIVPSLTEREGYVYVATLARQLENQLGLGTALGGRAELQAYESLLSWKGQVGRRLFQSRARLDSELSPQQRDVLARLRDCQSRLSALAYGERDREVRMRLMEKLLEDRNGLEAALERSLGSSTKQRALTFEELRASLPEHSAVVDFFAHRVYRPARPDGRGGVDKGFWSEPHIGAWITRVDREEPVHLDLGPAAQIREATHGFLQTVVGSGYTPDPAARRGLELEVGQSEPGSHLREILWDPIAPHLASATLIFVSPDSFIGTLPFEIMKGQDGSYLVESLRFVYMQDVAAIRSTRERMPELDSLLCAGGLDFDRRAEWKPPDKGSRAAAAPGAVLMAAPLRGAEGRGDFFRAWAPLPGMKEEASAIGALHEAFWGGQGRRLLLEADEASEERLKREMPRYAVVHLATHGFFQSAGLPSLWDQALEQTREQRKPRELHEEERLVGNHPGLLSGVVCSGANAVPLEGRDDGYLTAEEASWLDLSGVELVVLSACETGLGRPQSGEGLIGLRRALRSAGAKTVVTSLWQVPDRSTSRLMQSFYLNLWVKKMGRLEALHAAQIEMLARNRTEHGDGRPWTWGAFVLDGDWR
jgi:CHAT domain-containing protein/tetratricopeptide (TPR) repeat protein